MYNSTREFEACVHVNSKPVTEVVHNGQTFIEGRKKSTYELHFRNNSNKTVLVVPSVDGLSVIDGQRAGKQSPGYVIGPWDSVNVPGWTVNGREAAEFIFHAQGAYHDDEQTYAEEMGEDPANQGAIGFMVFHSLPDFYLPRRGLVKKSFHSNNDPLYEFQHDGNPRGMASPTIGGYVPGSTTNAYSSNVSWSGASCAVDQDSLGNTPNSEESWVNADADEGKALGTGFGEAVEFETQQIEFQRELNPCAVFALFYDTLKNLRKMGVPVEHFNRHYSESMSNAPNPFPNSPEVTGYANTPRGWTGRSGSNRRRKTRS